MMSQSFHVFSEYVENMPCLLHKGAWRILLWRWHGRLRKGPQRHPGPNPWYLGGTWEGPGRVTYLSKGRLRMGLSQHS